MSIGRQSRYFKILVIAFVALVVLLVATRQRISRTVAVDAFDSQRAFIEEVEAKLAGKNDQEDIYKSNEVKKAEVDAKLTQQEDIAIDENVEGQIDGDVPVLFDDSMPGAYLKVLNPASSNQSYCKYNYGFPYDLVYTSKDYLFPPQLGKLSEYRVIYNITEAYGIENISQVTYATHITANFAYFIPQLLRQWEGPVTIAAFVPDLDSAFLLEQINQFCYCEPEMHRVSIHIVTHKLWPFSKKDIYFDRPENCIPQDSSKFAIFKEYDETLIYPINVLRNVARTSALTKYVLLSDIELMPSKGLASGFLEMLQKFNKTNPKEVFVVPIFEVEKTETVPENKGELLKLLDAEKAVYFHGMICKHCQRFPGIDDWMKSGYSENIKPLITVKRHEPYHRWEPIFIGTNNEPLYSEQLSWEGLQDKMTQALEMCLQNYVFTILDNAFLCHWPGIRKQKVAEEEWRADFVEQNKVAYKEIIGNLRALYEDIPACNVNYTSANLSKKNS